MAQEIDLNGSFNDQVATGQAIYLRREAMAYSKNLHPIDRHFLDTLDSSPASEKSPLALLTKINAHSTAHFKYNQDESGDRAQLAHAIAIGEGDCDDWAGRNYALAIRSGIPPDRLRLIVGTMSGMSQDGSPFEPEDHVTLLYTDPSGQKYLIDNNCDQPVPVRAKIINNQTTLVGTEHQYQIQVNGRSDILPSAPPPVATAAISPQAPAPAALVL